MGPLTQRTAQRRNREIGAIRRGERIGEKLSARPTGFSPTYTHPRNHTDKDQQGIAVDNTKHTHPMNDLPLGPAAGASHLGSPRRRPVWPIVRPRLPFWGAGELLEWRLPVGCGLECEVGNEDLA